MRTKVCPIDQLGRNRRIPLVLLRSGFCTRELIEEGLNQTDIRANILAEFDSIDAIVSCVEEVPAISILPEHACHWQAYPGIKIIPLRGDRWKRSVGLITPRIAAPLPAVSCFVDFLHVNIDPPLAIQRDII